MSDRLTEIKARRALITKGDWRIGDGDPKKENEVAYVRGLQVWGAYGAVACKDDAMFIAAAPADIDWLITEIEILRTQLRYAATPEPQSAVSTDDSLTARSDERI